MNLRQTIEVAALAAMQADKIIRRPEPISTEALHSYWKSSRVRLRCWFAALRSVSTSLDEEAAATPDQLSTLVGWMRSILVAELLTRVWSAVLTARDEVQGENLAGELVRNVSLGQQEARQEVLKLIADERRLPQAQATEIDRLRHRVERWTDLLLGPIVEKYNVAACTFDAERALESVRRMPSESGSASPLLAINHLTLLGLSHTVPLRHENDHVGAALDMAVAHSVLSALPRKAIGRRESEAAPASNVTDESSALPEARSAGSAAAYELHSGIRFAALRRHSQ